MDEAGRYTAEHTGMDANIEIGKLKHLLTRLTMYLMKKKKQQ